MKKTHITIIFFFTIGFVISQTNNDFVELEKRLGTNSKTGVLFHQIITNDSIKLNYPGMILGVEKVKRKYLSNGNKRITPKIQRTLYGIDLNKYKSVGLKKTIRRARKILNDPKIMTFTHWIEFDKLDNRVVKYNLYDKLNTNENLLENSISHLRSIKESIQSKLKSGQYTHVIFAATGWNNDQKKSIETYNTWLKNITTSAEKNNFKFKPYFIGLTWPSTWKIPGGKIVSYFNKANDADEIGMTIANLIIWENLLPLMDDFPDIELVVLGHSFGSRILTRAAHSKIILNKKIVTARKIDLMIAVQGAFSVNRFLNKKSAEGRIYTTFSPWERFIATCSKYDKAVDNAFYTTMIGNDKSVKKLLSEKSKFPFCKIYVNSKGILNHSLKENIHNIVVADDLIYEGDIFRVKAHSDHQKPRFGDFIYNILKNYN